MLQELVLEALNSPKEKMNRMKHYSETEKSHRLSKGLTALMLLLSLFLFTGNGAATWCVKPEVANTEIVVSESRQAAKSIFSFQQAWAAVLAQRPSLFFHAENFENNYALLAYSRLMHTKARHIFSSGLHIESLLSCLPPPVKKLPQSSDEHFSPSHSA